MVDPRRIARNLAEVRQRIARAAERAGRLPAARQAGDARGVCLVAVTKTVGLDEVRALYDLGVRDFGENRVADAAPKLEALAALDIVWHMVGHVQRNKVRRLIGAYRWIHSVDSLRLLEEIDRRAATLGVRADVLLEVNVSGEASKFGLPPDAVAGVLAGARALAHVRPAGLMTMAPVVEDAERARPLFRALRGLRDACAAEDPSAPLPELSMGMTQDYEAAIEEGATFVRIGAALFR